MKVLITGGAGYIGSTIASAMKDTGYTPVILDSLVTGKKEFVKDHIFYHGDICNRKLLEKIFADHNDISCTIHCAALIVVPESVIHPYKYYTENVCKSLEFFKSLIDLKYPRIIFSSSAAIYAPSPTFQVNEDSPLAAQCPYAMTKIIMESVLKDFCNAYPLQCISLRYFNPIGADPRLRTGPHDKNPTHLLGLLVETAAGRREVFQLTGVNWPTRDGSGIRDYIHVWDLATAHIAALKKFDEVIAHDNSGARNYTIINLGTEKGVTVKEFIRAFEKTAGKKINIVETSPRPGDVAGGYASCEKALKLLGWKVTRSIEEGITDALAWDKKRPEVLGY
ncbi:MAG: UDP-glucose 4-epimerase GalE [Spirochaetales bacterium]|nr:UDP-glucose 4-epimerase GalE [Spirochaetales bacterium]